MIAFKQARLIDGTGGCWEHAGLTIGDDGRIAAVYPQGLPPELTSEAIDLTGKTLLPGLIDCHVHVMVDAGPHPFDPEVIKDSHYLTLIGANNAARMLAMGVTTARDLGGIEFGDVALKRAIQEGLIPGPRLLVSGKLLTMTGGHGWFFGYEVDGPDTVRRHARLNLKMGADNIKMMASGGIVTPNVNPRCPSLTVEELQAGFEEAHKAGKLSACHAQSTQGIKNAIRAGVRTIEHGFWLDEECCELMLEHDVYYSVTLSAGHQMVKHADNGEMPDFIAAKIKAVIGDHYQSFQLARRMGVPIVCGTDAGTPFNRHGDCFIELQLMQQLGMTPMEAIVAATSTGAKALKLDAAVGTLEPGKWADLLVVSGNPLEDLGCLATPIMVYKEGQAVDLTRLTPWKTPAKIQPAEVLWAAQKFAQQGCACC